VTPRALARRYAQAMFDVAKKRGASEQAAGEIAPLAEAIREHGELRGVLENPAIPIEKKVAIADALLAAAGGGRAEVQRLVRMLAERGRLTLLPDIAEAYAELVLEANRVMPAEVVTAAPLSDETRAALVDALGKATGAEIRITERVDPAIIGGLVARVGSLVFDSSVTHQLEQLRQRLRAQM
jgi:F-type H+-transporting ATPase subunit delta